MRIVLAAYLVIIVGVSWLPAPLGVRLVLIVASWYVLVTPLLVWLGGGFPVDPGVRPFDPAVHDAAVEQLARLAEASAQLAPLGFRPVGELFIERQARTLAARRTMMLLVLDNDAGTRAVATAGAIFADARTAQFSWVQLATRYRTHTRVTSNFRPTRISAYDGTPRRREWFPQLRDAALLARAHEALIGRDGGGTPAPRASGPLHEVLDAELREEHRGLAERGYYRLDRSGTRWVPTRQGVVALAVDSTWPLSRLWNARARRRASALLRELGLASLETGRPVTG